MKFKTLFKILLFLLVITGIFFFHYKYFYQDVMVSFRIADQLYESEELNFTILLLIMFIFCVLVVISWKIISLVLFLPQHLFSWQQRRNDNKRLSSVSKGLNAMVLGQPDKQHKGFKTAADVGVDPVVTNYLAAVVTTDEVNQEFLYRRAANAEGDPLIQAMALAQIRLNEKQPAEAAEVLRLAGAPYFNAKEPLKLFIRACKRSGNTQDAFDATQKLLELEPTKYLRRKMVKLTYSLIKDAESSIYVKDILDSLNKSKNSTSSIAIAAARRFYELKDFETATEYLTKAWKIDKYDIETIKAIAKHGNPELVKQILSMSDELLDDQHKDVVLMCALADLAMRDKLYGQARKLLNDALQLQERRGIYIRLAKLADAEGQSADEANRLYRKAAEVTD